jgi:hypothetical protein
MPNGYRVPYKKKFTDEDQTGEMALKLVLEK